MTMNYQTYEQAAADYLARFRALRDARAEPTDVARRGAGDVPADTIVDHADEIAEVSASMVQLSHSYLDSPDPKLREGISGQLLSQAAAELQVATELLQIAQGEQVAPATTAVTRRSTRGAALRGAINALDQAMATPVSQGLATPGYARRAADTRPETEDEAKNALQQAAITTVGAVVQRVVETGGDMAFTLVFNTEWTAVMQSAGLVSKDIAQLLDKVKEGAGAFITRVITVATKTLANVYGKILALIGKDLQDQARQQTQQWLERVKESGKIDLFEDLVGKLYRVDEFKLELPIWLASTEADADAINATTASVSVLSAKFAVIVGRMNTISDIAGLAKFIQLPQVLTVLTGVRVALLAALVYAGHDYIGYRQGQLGNFTTGVAELVKENLRVDSA